MKPIETKELIRLREHCRFSTGVDGKPFRILEELITARTRLAEMERLSASQAEALDMMDRGVKL